ATAAADAGRARDRKGNILDNQGQWTFAMNIQQARLPGEVVNSSQPHPFGGIYASTVCPMTPDGRVDEVALASHLETVVTTDGMAGLLVNGHAGENFALSREEAATVVRIARQVSGKRKIVAGINSESADAAA